jgi:hypothetical protein
MNTDICNINLHIISNLCRVLKQGLRDLFEQKRHSKHVSRNRCLLKYATPARHQNINVDFSTVFVWGSWVIKP